MNKYIYITAIAVLGLNGCAHTNAPVEKRPTETDLSKQQITDGCVQNDDGSVKCPAGGSIGAPIED